jgi:hypothetical protein
MSTKAYMRNRFLLTRTHRWLALSVAATVGLAIPAKAQGPSLPKAPSAIASSPTRIVIALPDSGGFAINNQPIQAKDLEKQLVAIYRKRPIKILLVSRTPGHRSQDVQTLIVVARRIGIVLYESGVRASSI